jgi:hypothetical protein
MRKKESAAATTTTTTTIYKICLACPVYNNKGCLLLFVKAAATLSVRRGEIEKKRERERNEWVVT